MGFRDISDIVFPWDLLIPFGDLARNHPDGIIDLSVGTPVDPTPQVIQNAIASASDAHGYPLTYGTTQLREAVAGWFEVRRAVPDLDPSDILPTIGSKELVGLLPSLLHLGEGDVVVYPSVAYPTYEVGARLAGATPVATDNVADWRGDTRVKLVWVNSPGNPHGKVMDVAALREVVDAAREIGALVVSDECYAELPWTSPYVGDGVPSVLDPRVRGTSYEGLLVTYSLSKQSNMAGYRAAFVAGDGQVVRQLLALRKHLGMIVPFPVQQAMIAALTDEAHVWDQYAVYARRRDVLLTALGGASETFEMDGSEAGLYVWVRAGSMPVLKDHTSVLVQQAQSRMPGACWESVGYFAERGILVAPGAFYGPAGNDHVRMALTATDERISGVGSRLG